MLDIKAREIGDVVILDLDGKIMMGEGDKELETEVKNLLEKGHIKIVITMSAVPYIDSSGLQALVRGYSMTNKKGGRLKLVKLSKKVQDLLATTKLLTVFDVYESEDEAMKSFAS